MRVTQNMVSDRLVQDLRDNYAKLADTQRQAASGKRLNKPSDDPIGVRDAIRKRSDLDAINGQREGIGAANAWLESTDDTLNQVTELLHRARELTVQGANGTLAATDRSRLALEIDQLVNGAKAAMNTTVSGVQLFSGTLTTTPPYTNFSDTYQGDAGVIAREIGPGVAARVNVLGDAILGSGQGAADGRMLDALRDIADHLRGGTPTDLQALGTTDLQAIERNLDAVNDARATTGAAQNRVDAATSRLDDIEDAGIRSLSELEDVDLAQVLATLTSQQTAYQAALKSGASIIQPSLLDFLR